MTLLELMHLLRQHLKLLFVLPIVAAIATAGVSWGLMPNEYTAETSIYALTKNTNYNQSQGTNDDGVSYSDLSASQMLANDFAELAKNDQVQADTAQALGLESLSGYTISVNSSDTTRVIKVDVTGEDPENTALIANKLADEIGDTAVRVMNVEAVNVINQATTPTHPSGPNRVLYTAVAFLAGLFLAIVIIVVQDMVRTTVRNEADVHSLVDLPVIGRMPYVKTGRR